ncbi:hypothetical protein V8C86DRAFT_2872527 [Haematococcus lacustris]
MVARALLLASLRLPSRTTPRDVMESDPGSPCRWFRGRPSVGLAAVAAPVVRSPRPMRPTREAGPPRGSMPAALASVRGGQYRGHPQAGLATPYSPARVRAANRGVRAGKAEEVRADARHQSAARLDLLQYAAALAQTERCQRRGGVCPTSFARPGCSGCMGVRRWVGSCQSA